jgi:hypothetical protein
MATSLSKPWLLLVAVLLISLTLGVESPFGVWALADPKDLATSLFQVCGMMVALALPAAQFADASIDSLFALFEKAAPSSNTTDTPQFFEDHTKEYRSAFGAAWHGCICAFLSLLLASLFFVTPQEHCCPADAICFDTRGLILSTSLACLLVGTFAFLPAIKNAFGLHRLEMFLGAFEHSAKAKAPQGDTGSPDASNKGQSLESQAAGKKGGQPAA